MLTVSRLGRDLATQPAIVPFRHSKLTEMFQSFFVGDGKAVRPLRAFTLLCLSC